MYAACALHSHTYTACALHSQAASSLAKWDEVKAALDTLSTEVKIAREDGSQSDGAIDPTLWSCETLQILRLRLPKGALTVIPSDLGRPVVKTPTLSNREPAREH